VPLELITDVEQRASSSEVLLTLSAEGAADGAAAAATRSIECMAPAIVQFVVDTVRRAIESHDGAKLRI
jgi:hypothetical protein